MYIPRHRRRREIGRANIQTRIAELEERLEILTGIALSPGRTATHQQQRLQNFLNDGRMNTPICGVNAPNSTPPYTSIYYWASTYDNVRALTQEIMIFD